MEKLLYLTRTPVHPDALRHTRGTHAMRRAHVLGDGPYAGVLSVWVDCLERRAPLEDSLMAYATSAFDAYLVTSATLASPAQGPALPSSGAVGLFHRGCRERRRAFYARWYEASQRAWPRDAVVLRNSVVRPLRLESPVFDGIIEQIGCSLCPCDASTWLEVRWSG